MLTMLFSFSSTLAEEEPEHSTPGSTSVSTSEQTSSSAVEQVEKLHALLIQLMKSDTTYELRANRIPEQIENIFDIHTISRIALGSNWKNLAESEKLKVKKMMKHLIVSNYAGRFKRYKKEIFVTQSHGPISRKRHLVKTTLKTAAGEIVNLDYHFSNTSGGWKIYDVTANGVSDLALKRASYQESFKKSGLVGVIGEIQLQIQKNQSL